MTITQLELDAIHQGDCLELLGQMPDESVDLAFADPPFNIGFKYDQYDDEHADEDYIAWCTAWMRELHRVLKPSGVFWLAIGDEFAADLRVAAHRDIGFTPRDWVVWYYTFGQNCTRKFNRSHVHLFHFLKSEEDFTFNALDPEVRVPSARALVYGDRRANPLGRLPDDTWILRPQDLREDEYAFRRMDDTWYFSRVAGTFKERQGFHGCQMPEQLLGRILRISSNEGDVVLDPFAGSGTTLAVAKKLGRRAIGLELSSEYAKYGNERLAAAAEGDPLNGPENPIQSSPTTAAGRRLAGWGEATNGKQQKPKGGSSNGHSQEGGASMKGNAHEHAAPPPPHNRKLASAPSAPAAPDLRSLQQAALAHAFDASCEGATVDWMLCDPQLQTAFHEACRDAGLWGAPADWNQEALRLRKAGKLPKRATKSGGVKPSELDRYAYAGEIAWRLVTDKAPDASLDDVLSDPALAKKFDRAAAQHVEGVPAANLRWAALRLRKARHALAAKAEAEHAAIEGQDFRRFQPWERCRFDRMIGQRGVYLLRGEKKAPLYVGVTDDLGQRLAAHDAAKRPGSDIRHVSVILAEELENAGLADALWVEMVRRHEPALNKIA